WIIFVTFKLVKFPRTILKDRWLLFLVLWLFWTPILFTSSKSLIHTYILPCCFPLALFVATFWEDIRNKKTYVYTSLTVAVLSVVIILLAMIPGLFRNNTNTDKYLLENYKGENLFYLGEKTYSSQFYSEGRVKAVSLEKLDSIRIADKNALLIVRKRDSAQLDGKKFLIWQGEGRKSLLFKFGQ